MGFQSYIRNLLKGNNIAIMDETNSIIGYLEMLSKSDIDNIDLIEKFTFWRRKYMQCFLTWFEPTNERTARWLRDVILKDEDRIFFKIIYTNNELIGHVGAVYEKKYIEYDNLIRGGEVENKGYAYYVAKTFMRWLFSVSDVEYILGNCISSNKKALRFHERTGFKIHRKVPLRKIIEKNSEVRWVKDDHCVISDVYHYEIRLYRKDFIENA